MMITVLTASIPERRGMLLEALASVGSQTLPPVAHLVGIDAARVGAPRMYNALASGVGTEWLTFLDDDDLLDPSHLQTLAASAGDVDVVYARPRFVGLDRRQPHYLAPFDPVRLQCASLVPITALVRTAAFRAIGGFPETRTYDWDLWKAISRAGFMFRAVDEVTWAYRFHGRNHSWGELAA
jgi:hypothetical protein